MNEIELKSINYLLENLLKRVNRLELQVSSLEDSNINLAERVRSIMLSYGVIEPTAEDE